MIADIEGPEGVRDALVQTQYGVVRGRATALGELFVEVPYGADTSGTGRFHPPHSPQPWRGIRDCVYWTRRAPQNPDPSIGRTPRLWYSIQGCYYAAGQSEDCLSLNIWTPASGDDGQRPVVVWIHGGGYVVGHAASEMSDGANFAHRHDAVFVSITHRLNAFGFLHLAGHGDEFDGSGVLGLLDLLEGLRWIRENIAGFGGDPDRVTIIGESGGGAKVSCLLAMPEAQGLFHRAVCQSGVAMAGTSVEESAAYAEELIRQLGGRPRDPSVLLAASTDELLAAQTAVDVRASDFLRLGPVIDGRHLRAAPPELWAGEPQRRVPVMAGLCRDEVAGFLPQDVNIELEVPSLMKHGVGIGEAPILPTQAGLSGLSSALNTDVGAAAAVWKAEHPGASEDDIVQALLSDAMFRRPAIKLAEIRGDAAVDAGTWLYQLDWASPRLDGLGACHSTGVSLFFGNHELVAFTRGLPAASRVAEVMSSALASFARDGRPLLSDGSIEWTSYERQSRTVMTFDAEPRLEHDPDSSLRRAWDELSPRSLL